MPAGEVTSEDPDHDDPDHDDDAAVDHDDDAGYGGDADQNVQDEVVGWVHNFVPRDDLFDSPPPSRRKSRRGWVSEHGGDDDEYGWGRIKVFQKKKRGLRSERRRVQQVREAATRGWLMTSGEALEEGAKQAGASRDGEHAAPPDPAACSPHDTDVDEPGASEWVDEEPLQGWGPIAPFVGAACAGDWSRVGEAALLAEPEEFVDEEFVEEVLADGDEAPACPIQLFQRGDAEAEAGDARVPQHLRHTLPHGPQDVQDDILKIAGLVGGAAGRDGGVAVGGRELELADVRRALLPLAPPLTPRDEDAHEGGRRIVRRGAAPGPAARAAGDGAVVEASRSFKVKRLKAAGTLAGVWGGRERENVVSCELEVGGEFKMDRSREEGEKEGCRECG